MMNLDQEKRKQVADALRDQRDDYERRSDVVLRNQKNEELRVLLPRSMWAAYGVAAK